METAVLATRQGLRRPELEILDQNYIGELPAPPTRSIYDRTHTQADWNMYALAPHGVFSGVDFAAVSCASWSARNARLRSLERGRSPRVFRGFNPARPNGWGPSEGVHARRYGRVNEKAFDVARCKSVYRPDWESMAWAVNSFAELLVFPGSENVRVGQQIGYRAPASTGLERSYGSG